MIMQVMMLTTHDSSDYWLATIIMVLVVHQMEDSVTHWIKDYPADKNMIVQGKPINLLHHPLMEIYLVDSVINLFDNQALQLIS